MKTDTSSRNASNCSKIVGSILFIPALSVDQKVHLSDIKLDRGFLEFYRYCKSKDIPVIIVSRFAMDGLSFELSLILRVHLCSGMEPLIRAILSNLVGDDANNIEIISNSVDVHEDGSWNVKFRHPSRYCLSSFPPFARTFLKFICPQWIRARQVPGDPPVQGPRKPSVTIFLWRWRFW